MRVYILLFLLHLPVIIKLCSGIKWLAVSQTTFDVSQPQSCRRLRGLLSPQMQLCCSHPELMPTLVSAAQQVKKVCQETFSDMRWNCSSVALGPKYPADLSRGTREAGFLYALSAAGLSHAIARSCSSGELSLCSCGLNPGNSMKAGLRWGGCADNLHYGLHMGATFLDTPMNAKSSRPRASVLMHLHNSEVGRKALSDALQVVCKCHGISGSCSVKTCWRALQDLKQVAMELKTKYLSATKVVRRPVGSRTQLVPRDIDIRPIGEGELVYLRSSPDFCSADAKTGSLGTLHRQCNATSSGSDGCDVMCCGRGHSSFTEQVVEKCHCTYHWCCYVSCIRCHRTVVKHACN